MRTSAWLKFVLRCLQAEFETLKKLLAGELTKASSEGGEGGEGGEGSDGGEGRNGGEGGEGGQISGEGGGETTGTAATTPAEHAFARPVGTVDDDRSPSEVTDGLSRCTIWFPCKCGGSSVHPRGAEPG